MAPETFALARPDDPGRVMLWCRQESSEEDGTVRFHVINGRWDGYFSQEGSWARPVDMDRFPAVRVWEGEVPRSRARDYNDAIAWIEEQL